MVDLCVISAEGKRVVLARGQMSDRSDNERSDNNHTHSGYTRTMECIVQYQHKATNVCKSNSKERLLRDYIKASHTLLLC